MTETVSRLKFFPIALFGSVMGVSGLTLALQKALPILGLPSILINFFTLLSAILFMAITATYLLKSLRFPEAVQNEFKNPIAGHFFGAFSISILLIALLFKTITPYAASLLWYLGVIVHFGLTLILLNTWMLNNRWQLTEMTPAWFLPVVGNIIIPLGCIDFADTETGWFFFSVGFVFWIVLQGIVLYRLFFHPAMPKLLEPFLFIFIAPPAMGFLSYVTLNHGEIDSFARVLFYTALFFAILLFSQTFRFIKVPFAISWWAFTFPLAAIANASWVMYSQLHYAIYEYFALFFMSILTLLVIHLTFRTLKLIAEKKLCLPPPQTSSIKDSSLTDNQPSD